MVTAIACACLAGMFLGALNIAMRRGLEHVKDVNAGAAVIAATAFALIGAAAVVSGSDFEAADLWPFVVLGAFVPGVSQLLALHAVEGAGASRAGVLFGMAPLFSALIAIGAFHESLRWPLVAGTLLVVAGGIVLACEGDRPAHVRAYGAVLAVVVAAGFGLRDNVARAVGGEVSASPLAQAAAIMLGAAIVLAVNLLRQNSVRPRLQAALVPFGVAGLVTALAQATLLEALSRGQVTVVAPLVGTGVLWTVVFAAIFLRGSELVERRVLVVALLVVAGSTLVGATS